MQRVSQLQNFFLRCVLAFCKCFPVICEEVPVRKSKIHVKEKRFIQEQFPKRTTTRASTQDSTIERSRTTARRGVKACFQV